jgi:hypothetical protein
LSVTLDIDGLGPVTFCHATARDDNEFITVDSPISHYQAAFAAAPEPTVVIGHTHMPFDRLADTRRIINPGSVGLAYGHLGAAGPRRRTAAHSLSRSPRSVRRLRTCWVVHGPSGFAVTPRMCT